MDSQALNERLEIARTAGLAAGQFAMHYYRRDDLNVELKGDASPVTAADRGAEEQLRATISQHFPEDGILGEEFPERHGTNGYRWILDPIDGTQSFIRGVPLWGTLVGIEHDGLPVAGVIVLPALNEYLYAAVGQGAWQVVGDQPPRACHVSPTERLEDCLFCTTTVNLYERRNRLPAYERLRRACKMDRGWSDCYGYVLVATGQVDLMVDPEMNAWDCAAVAPILSEAGGSYTDWTGKSTLYGGDGIGSNGKLLEQAVAILQGS